MKTHGFERILLATDGSPEAEAAGRLATALAESSGAAVRVVHCWNLEVHHRHGFWDVEVRADVQKLIDDELARLAALNVRADGQVLRSDSDHVGAAIAAAARGFNADVVIVGSRGLSSWRSLLQHSVSHQVLSTVDCPVLIVREAGSSILHEPSRVLLAVAGGDDVVPGVRAAIAAACTPGSKVLVTHIAQALFGAHGLSYIEGDDDIQNTLDAAVSMLKTVGVATETRVATSGPVANAIAAIASQWQADIIVIGSTRMGDLASIIFGSVTHDLLRTTHTPVLVAERIRA